MSKETVLDKNAIKDGEYYWVLQLFIHLKVVMVQKGIYLVEENLLK